jgi:hypothetical protein
VQTLARAETAAANLARMSTLPAPSCDTSVGQTMDALGEDGAPSASERDADTLVALRSAAGVARSTAAALASMVGFLDAYVVSVAVPAIGRIHGDVTT